MTTQPAKSQPLPSHISRGSTWAGPNCQSDEKNRADDVNCRDRMVGARHATFAIAFAMVAALCIPTPAASAGAPPKSTPKTAKEPVKKKGGLKITHQRSPSEETAAARDRRLTRECKGAPNAGACLGYTRK